MRFTYIASDTTAGNAAALIEEDEATGSNVSRDVYVYKVLFGDPSDGLITILYDKAVAYGHASGIASVDSSDIATKITQPTAAAGKDWVREVNFSPPLQLDGGCVHTNDNCVTVVWEPVDEAK